MNQEFNIFNQSELPSICLCKPNKDPVRYIDTLIYNSTLNMRFNAVSELNFDVPKSITDGKETIDAYSLFKPKKLIRIGKINSLGEEVGDYFIITTVTETDDGSTPILSIEAQSLEAELMNKKLTAFTGTFPLLNKEIITAPKELNPSKTGLLEYICDGVLLNQWSVGEVDLNLQSIYRTFDVSDTTVYSFLVNDLERAYNCIVLFDTENRKINVYELTNTDIIKDTNIYLSYDNLLKSSDFSELSDEIATKLYCYGNDKLDIRSVNPLGGAAIYNFDYYTKLENGVNEWMSEDLRTAIEGTYTTVNGLPVYVPGWKDKINYYLSNSTDALNSVERLRYETTNQYLDVLFNIYSNMYLNPNVLNTYSIAKTERQADIADWAYNSSTPFTPTKRGPYEKAKSLLITTLNGRQSEINAQKKEDPLTDTTSKWATANVQLSNYTKVRDRRALEFKEAWNTRGGVIYNPSNPYYIDLNNYSYSNTSNIAKNYRLNGKTLKYGGTNITGTITPVANTTNYSNKTSTAPFDNTGTLTAGSTTISDNGVLFKNKEGSSSSYWKRVNNTNNALEVNNSVTIAGLATLPLTNTSTSNNKIIVALFNSTYAGIDFLNNKILSLEQDLADYSLNALFLTTGIKTSAKPTTTVPYNGTTLNKASNELTLNANWTIFGGKNAIDSLIALNKLELDDCDLNVDFLTNGLYTEVPPTTIIPYHSKLLNNSVNVMAMASIYQWDKTVENTEGYGGLVSIQNSINSFNDGGTNQVITNYYQFQKALGKRKEEYDAEIKLRDGFTEGTDDWKDHDLNAYFLKYGTSAMNPPNTTSTPFTAIAYESSGHRNQFIKYSKNILKKTNLYDWVGKSGLNDIQTNIDGIRNNLQGYTAAVPEGISINEVIEILKGLSTTLDYPSYLAISTHFKNAYENETANFSIVSLQTALTARENEYAYEQTALKALIGAPSKDKNGIADHTLNSTFLYEKYPSDGVPTTKKQENQLDINNIYKWNIYGGMVLIQSGLYAITEYTEVLLDLMANINDNLKLENNFTTDQLKELNAFTFENTYQNENIIITDTMTANKIMTQAKYLYDQSIDVLKRASQPRYEFSIESVNFLNIAEYKDTFTKSLELGCKVIVDIRENPIETVLLEIQTSFDKPEELSLTFSNRLRLDNSAYQYSDLIGQTVRTGSSVSFKKLSWNDWDANYRDTVSEFITSSLDASKNSIINSSSQEIIIDDKGLRARKLNDSNTDYVGKQVWLTNNAIVFTDNNWEEARLALGEVQNPSNPDDPTDTVYGIIASRISSNLIVGKNLHVSSWDSSNNITSFSVNASGVEFNNSKLIFKNTQLQSPYGITIDAVNGLRFGQFNGNAIETSSAKITASMDGKVNISGTVTSQGFSIGGWQLIDSTTTGANGAMGLKSTVNPNFFMYNVAPTSGPDAGVLWKLGDNFLLKKDGTLSTPNLKLPSGSVSGSVFPNKSITSGKIALRGGQSVTGMTSSSTATTATQPLDGITMDKFQSGAVYPYLNPFSASAYIQNGTFSCNNSCISADRNLGDLLNSANVITSDKLGSDVQLYVNLGSSTVPSSKLAKDAVNKSKLVGGFAVNRAKIALNSIPMSMFASDTVFGSNATITWTTYITASGAYAARKFYFKNGILTTVGA